MGIRSVVLALVLLAPWARAAAAQDGGGETVNRITVGGHGFRQTLLDMSPRASDRHLRVAFETLRTDGPTDAFARYGMLNGSVRYSRGDARHESSVIASARYARLTGGVTHDAQLLSLGAAYQRSWIVSDRLRTTAVARGELHRLARRGTDGTRAASAASMDPTFEMRSQLRARPWLSLDAGVGWAGSRSASAAGVALGEIRGWAGALRLHAAPRLVDAEAAYRLAPRTRIVLSVVNLTDAPPVDLDFGEAVSRADRFAWATADIDSSAIAPRTVRFTVEFGF